MRYELNIGLDREGVKSTYGARAALLTRAMTVLDGMKDFTAEVIGDLAGVDEPCLYVTVDTPEWFFLDQDIDTLCRALGQDCIAVYIPSQSAGLLVGPRAAAWGEFNPEYFRRPAVAVAA